MQSRPGNTEHLMEKDINQSREPVKGGRGTMLPADDDHFMGKVTTQSREHVKGGRGTMLPSEDDDNFMGKVITQSREHVKGGRGTMLPPDDENTVPPTSQGGVISGGPNDRISDTGLTSQSFGTNDTYDHHEHQYHEVNVGGQEGENGPELQRLPSYEVQNTRNTNDKGMRKASFNLDKKNSQDRTDVLEDEDFTTGLMRGPGPQGEAHKHTIVDWNTNVQKSTTTGEEKHKNYQAKQKVDKENVGGTYLL